MSNVIPIVSSSPPPLDDDAGFGWEEDDDDFGNFTSAPTIPADTNGSNFEVNWSTSETSLPQSDVSNKSSSLRSGNTTEIDMKSNDSHMVDPHSLSPPPPANIDSLNSGSEDYDDFQDFAQFDQDSSPQETNQPLPDSPYKNTGVQLKPLGSDSHSNSITEAVESSESDEFQNFAQFNDIPASEEHRSPADIHDLPIEQTEIDGETAPPYPNHSTERVGSSSPDDDGDVDSAVTDSENSMSIVVKNNESLYSNASTIDSGVFTTDLSPSTQSFNSHEPSQSTECEKATSPEVNNDVIDNTDSESVPNQSPETDADLQQIDQESCAKNSSCNTSPDQNNLASQECPKTADADDDNVVSAEDEDWSEFNSTLVSDNITSFHAESDQIEQTEQNAVSISSENVQHSPSQHSSEPQSETTQPLANSLSHPESKEAKTSTSSEEKRIDQEPCESEEMPNACKDSEVVVQDANESGDDGEWGDFDSGHEEKTEQNAIHIEGGDQCNSKSSVIENECVENAESDTDNRSSDLTHGSQSQVVPGEEIPSALSDQRKEGENEDEITENCTEPAESQDDSAVDKGDEDEMDKEFGDFRGQWERKESGPHEVAPIQFRKSICEGDEDVNADDDFSFDREGLPSNEGNESDDFDAFGTFNDDDDFGDFDSAKNVPESSVKAEEDAEFGEFGNSSQTEEGEPGWADFEAAPTASTEEFSAFTESQPKTTSHSGESKQDKAHKVQLAVISCFPESTQSSSSQAEQSALAGGVTGGEDGDDHCLTPLQNDESLSSLETVVELGLSNAIEAKQQTWTVVQHPSKKDPKVCLWGQLKDVDSSHALMYGWPASHCSKEIFSTLHIDTLNVLFTQKKQAVPFFAAGLSILEPIRRSGGGQGGRQERKSKPVVQPTLLDTSTSRPEVPPNATTAQDIPPVDFDWSSSGLTNPLTANTLDLDFLVVQGSETCEKISVFKADCEDSARPSLQPLEDILKKSTPTAKLATHEVLSPEALRILERMPDLSFMQSPVLMFPVKQ